VVGAFSYWPVRTQPGNSQRTSCGVGLLIVIDQHVALAFVSNACSEVVMFARNTKGKHYYSK